MACYKMFEVSLEDGGGNTLQVWSDTLGPWPSGRWCATWKEDDLECVAVSEDYSCDAWQVTCDYVGDDWDWRPGAEIDREIRARLAAGDGNAVIEDDMDPLARAWFATFC